MPVIETHELTRKFGDFTAVENLTLVVEKGEVLGFLGPNGAGKTTTIRMLAGIISPTRGYAVVAGQRTDQSIELLHEKIGFLTESPGFYQRLSARRNLEYFGGFYAGIKDLKAQVRKYLGIVGLLERAEKPVATFSRGMKQRLALARALLPEPEVLFLDEPTSGLDPEAAREVRDLIVKLSTEGRTIFLSTHNLAEAEQICHRISIFRTRLLVLGKPEDLRRQLFSRRVVIRLESIGSEILASLKRLAFVKKLDLEGNRLSLEMDNPQAMLPEVVKEIVQAGGRILEANEERRSLEEIYLNLIREDKK